MSMYTFTGYRFAFDKNITRIKIGNRPDRWLNLGESADIDEATVAQLSKRWVLTPGTSQPVTPTPDILAPVAAVGEGNVGDLLQSQGDDQPAKWAANPSLPRPGDKVVNVMETRYGAIGDGTYHPLSERFTTLSMAKAMYPCAIALSDTIDWAAIQTALDYVDGYNQGDPSLTSSYTSGQRGGEVKLPLPKVSYFVNRSIYTEARIRFTGIIGTSAGGKSSNLKADPNGDYTNGPYAEKFMVKIGRRSTGNYWWHSGSLEYMQLDCNHAPGLAGYHCWGSGENSLVNCVNVINTGWTDRTVNDITYTADSKVITSNNAAFTQDDVTGLFFVGDAVGFPNPYPADVSFSDGAFTKDSDIYSSPSSNFTNAVKGMELRFGATFGTPIYVKAVLSPTQLQMSEKFRWSQSGVASVLTKPRTVRIERVVSPTQAWLRRPALTSGVGSATIRRPRPGGQYHEGGATMNIKGFASFGNSGPGIEIINGRQGWIEISGDNDSCLVKLRDCGIGDPGTFDIHLKGEKQLYGVNDYDLKGAQEPYVLSDGCGGVLTRITGGTVFDQGGQAVVRVQRKAGFSGGFPAFEFAITGANPYNTEGEWEIFDADTGRGVKVAAALNTGQWNPLILWNRPIIMGGDVADTFVLDDFLGDVRRTYGTPLPTQKAGTEKWRHWWSFGFQPSQIVQGSWQGTYLGNAVATTLGYNASNAQNDEARWWVDLSKGTWRLDLNGYKGTDRAITTWDISYDNGASWTTLGTVDQNAAATISVSSFTNIVVPNSGRAILRARALTRTSTTGWIMGWSVGEFIRTA
jgi:hypothetical protein